ncbi:hypothetical protein TNCV_1476661 [Trichonephila clavipes]|nr:hypothetical protein TNCV_1476661 [Trichonephila clavipes]
MSGLNESTTRSVHPGRNKKRKLNGNRFNSQNDTEFTSASATKLKNSMDMEVPIASSFAQAAMPICDASE